MLRIKVTCAGGSISQTISVVPKVMLRTGDVSGGSAVNESPGIDRHRKRPRSARHRYLKGQCLDIIEKEKKIDIIEKKKKIGKDDGPAY